MSTSDKVRANDWLQGRIISAKIINDLIKIDSQIIDTDFFIVISQDCDVINPDYKKEPFVELLKVSLINKLDGNFSFGKNPRNLCFTAKINDISKNCLTNIHDKIRIPRQLLEELTPNINIVLESHTIRQITAWVAKRYIRPAFPDELVRRMGSELKKIQALLKKKGQSFEKIFLIINSLAELPESEKYDITIIAVLAEEEFSEQVKIVLLQQVLNEFVQILRGCTGISIEDGLLRSKQQITMEDLEVLLEWDFEYISNQIDTE